MKFHRGESFFYYLCRSIDEILHQNVKCLFLRSKNVSCTLGCIYLNIDCRAKFQILQFDKKSQFFCIKIDNFIFGAFFDNVEAKLTTWWWRRYSDIVSWLLLFFCILEYTVTLIKKDTRCSIKQDLDIIQKVVIEAGWFLFHDVNFKTMKRKSKRWLHKPLRDQLRHWAIWIV